MLVVFVQMEIKDFDLCDYTAVDFLTDISIKL